MTEKEDSDLIPFDAEWEIAKMSARFTDILNMIEELKAKDRVLSSRISRLKIASLEERDEDLDDVVDKQDVRSQIETMSLEERAILFAKLTDERV